MAHHNCCTIRGEPSHRSNWFSSKSSENIASFARVLRCFCCAHCRNFSVMATANTSGDAARGYIDEMDSDCEFQGFSASDIEQASSTALHPNSNDEFDISDLELDSDSDTDSEATNIATSISGSDDQEPQPARQQPASQQPARQQPAQLARPQHVCPQPARHQPVRPQPTRPQTERPQPARPQPARPQPARPPRSGIAQPRRPSQSRWSGNLVKQADLPYQHRAQTGVTDHEQASELSPLGLFSLFFTDYLLRDIVSETNRYAGQCLSQPPKQGEKHLPWHPLTVDTWIIGRETQQLSPLPLERRCHGCDFSRYFVIYTLSTMTAQTRTDKMLKTWKVQKLIDYLVKRYRDVYTPRHELSVHETMLKFKSRLSIKQYIKIKPVKWGIKLFTLAESTTGYVLDVLPYTGKHAQTAMSKMAQTVLDVSCHFLNHGHHFFFDNFNIT